MSPVISAESSVVRVIEGDSLADIRYSFDVTVPSGGEDVHPAWDVLAADVEPV